MLETKDADYPLEVESVESSPLGGDRIVVRLEGHWRGRPRASLEGVMLVVEANGRRHRFPSIPQPRRSRLGRPGTWSGNFALPTWLGSHLEGNASLKLGDVTIPIPPGSFGGEEQSPEPAEERPPAQAPEPAADRSPAAAQPADQTDQTVAALRAELERRAVGEGQVRGQLTEARAALEASAANQARLEAAHGELRQELEQLRDAVAQRIEVESKAVVLAARVEELGAEVDEARAERERTDAELARLRGELVTSEVSRDAALSEAAGLRAELDRLGGQLAAAREHSGSGRSDVDEAETLLAQARALREQMSERAGGRLTPSGTE